jgi:hypothetical protein
MARVVAGIFLCIRHFPLHHLYFRNKSLNSSSHLPVRMTTTEIATVPLIAGTSLSDSDRKMLKETFAHLQKIDGFQLSRFGIPLESPENLQILIGKTDH